MSASETKWVRLGDYIVQQDERISLKNISYRMFEVLALKRN